MEFTEFLSRLDGVQQQPSGIAARCPAHDDRVRSLSVNHGDHGGIVVKCHAGAGCPTESIVAAMGLAMADLMGKPYVVETYDYTDKTGAHVLYKVERWANPKTFRCVPYLPPPAQRVLFQWPAIEWAREHGRTLFVVEGEKDVLTLAGQGVPATCNVTGAGHWLPHYNEVLAGLNVIVVADNDETGRNHARSVAAGLKGFAASVSVMYSPYGKDVTDLIDAGYTVDRLQNLPDVEGLSSLYTASSIQTRSVDWAWPGYIPFGKLSIVEGDPGDGKSVLTIDLAARWSTGAPLPGQTHGRAPLTVILVSAEDDMDDTIAPRLRRAGANLELVKLVPHGRTPTVPFEFGVDLPNLLVDVTKLNAKIVVFDPLSAFLGEKTDSHNDASVRRALQPLKAMATLTGAAILVVRHLNKGSGGKAIYRGGGSIGFIGAARAAYLVAEHPEDPATKVFACTKMNLAPKPPTLTYEIKATEGEPYLVWGEPLDMGAQAVLDGPERKKSAEAEDELASKRRARQMECAFLWDIASDGPMPWADIVAAGKEAGFSEISLRRARADAGLVPLREEGGNRSTRWGRTLTTNSDENSPSAHLLTPRESRTATPRAEQVEQVGNRDDSLLPDGTTEDQRDEQLDALPLVCSICATTDLVSRFGRPWWVVRCVDHNPRTYGEGI